MVSHENPRIYPVLDRRGNADSANRSHQCMDSDYCSGLYDCRVQFILLFLGVPV